MLARFRMPSRSSARALLALGALAATLAAAPPGLARSDQEPFPRFEDALCPGVAGLRRDAAEAMVGRIRDNAELLGVGLADNGDCEANLVVAFVDDGRAFLERLRATDPRFFGDMSLADRDSLLASPGPVRVFQRVIPHSRDGRPIPRHENLIEVPETAMWMAHSKIYAATRNDITYALVLIDRDEIEGIGVGQLADYATFVGLTRVLPEAYDDSILALFASFASRPMVLSEFDRTYLGALYEGIPNLPGEVRLAQLEAATGRDIFK